MTTLRWSGTARTAFAHLSQGSLLKPTALWDLMSASLNEFWPLATGGSGNDFLARTDVRTLLMQVAIERTREPVPDEHDLVVDFATTLGALPGGDTRPPRYGGIDRVVLRDPGRPDGDDVVARWTAHWLWFHALDDGGLTLLHEPAPGVIVAQDSALEEPERPPRPGGAVPGLPFRWTARETDTNDHVFSLSYVERAENALADAGVDTAALHGWRAWYQRPSFLREQMSPEVEQGEGEWTVVLRNVARDSVSAVVRATA